MNQHLVVYIRFEVNHSLLPSLEIISSDDPYDYAIMSPDYTWKYYAKDPRTNQFRAVTMLGELK
jgi:hypothetical protein